MRIGKAEIRLILVLNWDQLDCGGVIAEKMLAVDGKDSVLR